MRRAILLAVALVCMAACAGILGLRPDAGPRVFPHRAHVVRGVSCTECHAGVDRASDTGPLHLPDDASCLTCHKKPHDRRSCLGCHGDPWTAAAAVQAREHIRFSHDAHRGAARGNCARCHVGVGAAGEHLRPPMAVCMRCHEHEAGFKTRQCDTCHVDLATEAVQPASHLAHDGDFLREHGARAASSGDLCATCHTERSCAACHGVTAPAVPARLAFDDPGRASVHRAGFVARHSVEAAAQPGLCSTCHQPEMCTDCHRDRQVAASEPGKGRASPHPAGWIGLTASENLHGRAARRDPASCAGCHGGAGEMLCVGCHRVGGVGGSIHPPGWSSRQALSDLPCRLCHTGTP